MVLNKFAEKFYYVPHPHVVGWEAYGFCAVCLFVFLDGWMCHISQSSSALLILNHWSDFHETLHEQLVPSLAV